MHTKLTLRDHFAGLAMQAILTGRRGEDIAEEAYNTAGHMIRERNKHHKVRHEELCNVSDSGEV
jgi:hypothetical protein